MSLLFPGRLTEAFPSCIFHFPFPFNYARPPRGSAQLARFVVAFNCVNVCVCVLVCVRVPVCVCECVCVFRLRHFATIICCAVRRFAICSAFRLSPPSPSSSTSCSASFKWPDPKTHFIHFYMSSLSLVQHTQTHKTHTHILSHTHTSLQFALFLLASIFFHSHFIFLNGMHRTSLFKSSSLKCAALCMCVRCMCVCVCVYVTAHSERNQHQRILQLSTSAAVAASASTAAATSTQLLKQPLTRPSSTAKVNTHERRSLPATFEWACRERQAKLRVPSAYSSFCILNCDADRPESNVQRATCNVCVRPAPVTLISHLPRTAGSRFSLWHTLCGALTCVRGTADAT